MALGAKSADVFRIVMSSTAGNVGGGLAVGLLLSIAFDKLATKWVMETSRDPLILAGVTLLLLVAAALACFVPARRGASVGTREALRYEWLMALSEPQRRIKVAVSSRASIFSEIGGFF